MAGTIDHDLLAVGKLHAIHNLTYPDATNRQNGTNEGNGITITPKYLWHVAKQDDDDSLWMLIDIAPPLVWLQIQTGAPTFDMDDTYNNFGSSAALVAIDGFQGQTGPGLEFRLSNDNAFEVSLGAISTTGTDGFLVTNGTNNFNLLRQGSNDMDLDADLGNFDIACAESSQIVVDNAQSLTFQTLGSPESAGDIIINAWRLVDVDGVDIDLTATDDITFAGTNASLDGAGVLSLLGSSSKIILESNTQTSGNVVSIKSNPASASTATVMRLEADGPNWGGGAHVLDIVTDNDAAIPFTINNGSSDTFFIGRSGTIVTNGNIQLTGGGSITSSSNGNIVWLPNGTGITVVGSGSTSHSLNSPDDLLVSGELEVGGTIYADSGMLIPNGDILQLGDSADALILYNVIQTAPALMQVVSSASRSLLLVERGDRSYNFGHAAQSNPTQFIHSSNQSTTEWLSHAHNQTDAERGIGTGGHVTNYEAPTSLADDASFDLPDSSAGFCHMIVGDGEEHAYFSWTSAAVVTLVTNSANVVNSDTDTKFCIFDNGTSVRVRNRLGATKTVTYDYHYTTNP